MGWQVDWLLPAWCSSFWTRLGSGHSCLQGMPIGHYQSGHFCHTPSCPRVHSTNDIAIPHCSRVVKWQQREFAFPLFLCCHLIPKKFYIRHPLPFPWQTDPSQWSRHPCYGLFWAHRTGTDLCSLSASGEDSTACSDHLHMEFSTWKNQTGCLPTSKFKSHSLLSAWRPRSERQCCQWQTTLCWREPASSWKPAWGWEQGA